MVLLQNISAGDNSMNREKILFELTIIREQLKALNAKLMEIRV